MKTSAVLLIALALGTIAWAQPPAAPPVTTVGAALDREIALAERQLIGVVEAMPEAKFNFTPESLDIKGSAFKGVYTFAGLAKHLAAANYFLWGGAGGDPIPASITGVKGPESMTSRAEIIALLKACSPRVITLRRLSRRRIPWTWCPVPAARSPRVFGISFGVAHAYDEYGQMVEYLRMCGVVPPASAPR